MRALLMALCFAATTSVPTAQAESIQSAKADIEKWIDADGQVHYGDMPPPEAEASPLHVRPNVIEVEQAAVPAAPIDNPGQPAHPAANTTPDYLPPERTDIDRYVAHCRANRGVDCELEARQMIDGPAPVLFPGDPAVFPRPDLSPPPPGLPLKYSIEPPFPGPAAIR